MSRPNAGEPPDAVELLLAEVEGCESTVLVYPTGGKPVVDVRADGRWCIAVVRERHDYQGRTAYRVIFDPGTGHHVIRTYWWPSPGLRHRFSPPR